MKLPLLIPIAGLGLTSVGCQQPSENQKENPDDSAPVLDTGEPQVFEEGCITVNGDVGYKWLNDAIRMAEEGSLIEICEGSFEEAVLIDKPVTILGAGSELTLWTAPTNHAPFTIEPGKEATQLSGVTLQGVGITSTRSAIEVSSASDLRLSDIQADAIPNYGVSSKDSELTISDSGFQGNEWGAVLADGGSVSVSGCRFDGNTSFGVKAEGGAALTIADSSFSNTLYTVQDDGSIADGFPIFGDEGSAITLSGNHFYDNEILAVYAVASGDLSMSGDLIEGGIYGVLQVYGDLSAQDVTVTDATEFGVYFIAPSGGSLAADGLDISGDPEVVSDYAWDSGVLGSIGLYAESDAIEITNSQITGYNSNGAFLMSYEAGGGNAVLSNLLVDRPGRRGLYTYALDVTADEVSVVGTRELDDGYDGYIYIDLPAGWVIYGGNADISGGEFSDNQGWGISGLQSNISVQGASFSGNTRPAVIDYGGTSAISGSSFTASASGESFGTVCAYENSGMVLYDNDFVENKGTSIVDYSDSLGYPYWYVYYDSGLDVYSYNGSVTVYENRFERGDQSIYLYNSDGDIHDNSWSKYNRSILYVYGEGSDGVLFEDNIVEDFGGALLYSYYADVEVEGLQASAGGTYDVAYECWIHKALSWSSSYTSYQDAFYLYQSRALLQDVQLQDVYADGMYAYDSAVELDEVSFEDVSTGSYGNAIDLYWSSSDVEFYATDLEIDAPNASSGLYLSQSSSANYAALEVSGLQVVDPRNYGIYTSGLGGGSLLEVDVSGAGSYGAYISSSELEFEDSSFSANQGSGLYASSATLGLAGCDASDNAGDGAYVYGGSATISDGVYSGNQGSGLVLQSTVASVLGNQVVSNAQYGLSCSSAVIGECGNTVQKNGLADNNGCDESCVIAP